MMDLSAFYNQFRDETAENVRVLSDGLLVMEQIANPSDPEYREQVDKIFRAVHTIKGSARLLGFETIGRLAHTMEHLLSIVRDGQRTLDSSLATDLLKSGDAIAELANAAISGEQTNVPVDALIQKLEQALQATHQPAKTPEAPAATLPAQAEPEPEVEQIAPEAPSVASAPEAQPQVAPTPAMANPLPSGDLPRRASTRANSSRQTVRVRVDRLDRLINLTGELALEYQAQTAHIQALQDLQHRMAQQERMLASLSTQLKHFSEPSVEFSQANSYLEEAWNVTKQMRHLVRSHTEQLTVRNDQHRLLVNDLEREVMAARLLPASTVFANLPRAVRELSSELGKEVALHVSGETTELDRKLLEAINDPLIHLVRNAIDHGLETAQEREAKGKARQGRLTISALAVGGEVRIVVKDDGRGINPEMIRKSAVQKGLISQQAADLLNETDALDLLFTPGFSTASLITDISGRGVGLDVVRSNITELGGQVLIESQPGQGTTITLALPLTLVTTRVLLAELAESIYGLPASGCRSVIWVDPSEVQSIEGQACISYGERTLPLVRLADLLGVEGNLSPNSGKRMPTLLIGSNQRLFGVIVDRLVDEREAVVKPIGPLFEQQRRYNGVLQLEDGQLALLLNPVILVQEARGLAMTPRMALDTPAPARLLVADDSFTTRELIRSILQSAGYDVTVAIDGADALQILRSGSFDLVVSDVEMPRMTGFQLTSRIRRELGLVDLPVIIVTSLASDADKQQGLEAGAQAYLVKSQFNQDNLLNTIRQLLGR
jgi:two-component system chemotaxis sensor kinase CheA